MNGLILINKEQDYTSFDVVAIIRKLFSQKKVGHLGTLDPMATGVLPVLIGRATKLGQYLPVGNKEYIASFRTGFRSDTDDIWGQVEATNSKSVTEKELLSVLPMFMGKLKQIPPMYSAKKINGVKLYKLARQGIEIERKPCDIEIFALEYLGIDEQGDFKIRILCSEGTYIRTLICDIGKALGTDLLMTSLIRTASHGFSISDSLTLGEIKQMCGQGDFEKAVMPISELLSCYPSVSVTEKQAFRFQNGGRLSLERVHCDIPNGYCRIMNNNSLIGLGKTDEISGEIKPVFQNIDI